MILTQGNYYLHKGKRVRLIRISVKGFNFLNEKTGACVLHRHILPKGYGAIPIPSYDLQFKFGDKVTKDITYEMGKEE